MCKRNSPEKKKKKRNKHGMCKRNFSVKIKKKEIKKKTSARDMQDNSLHKKKLV